MTRGIHGPVRRDVFDKWHVSGNGRGLRHSGCVWVSLMGGEFSATICHFCLQRCNAAIFIWYKTRVVISCRSIEYLLDNHVPEHTHPLAYYGKWIILLPVACYHKYHNTNVVPNMLHESHAESSVMGCKDLNFNANVGKLFCEMSQS